MGGTGVIDEPAVVAAADSSDRRRPVRLFLWVWLQVGFVSGTLTLLGPVRWISDRAEAAGWEAGAEDLAVRGVILLFVLVSALVALAATRGLRRIGGTGRLAGLFVLVLFAAATLWLWLTPSAMAAFQASEVTVTGRFTFGPYPSRARLEALEREGYEGVISLLHPAVVPFEPKLLADERAAAEAVGIEVIHAPMLPWVSDNEGALATVREVAERGSGRYYVHCYLGRDRVEVVRRFLAAMDGVALADVVRGGRSLSPERPLERGPVVELDAGVFLTPFPTDEELFAYFQGGDLRHVVSLLDPDNAEDVAWIDREAAALEQVRIPMTLSPVHWRRYRPAAALRAVSRVREGPRPVAVHAFRADGVPWEALVLAWQTGLPPLPPSLFGEPLTGGRPRAAGVNVALGPAPAPSEFGSYLTRKGIRGVVYVGDGSRPGASAGARAAEIAGLDWRRVPSEAGRVLDIVSEGGPWYVYGPGLGAIQGRVEAGLRDPGELLRRVLLAAAGAEAGVP